MERYIVHLDMDAFFAAIEQRDNFQFRNKPVIVGADPKRGKGRGVVSTCSYEARKFGIHSAMPVSVAYRMCPHAIFLPVNMEKYSKVSKEMFRVLFEFTPCIEPVSIDEAFLDITGSYHLFGSPQKACLRMKIRIREEMELSSSVGLAPTKAAAKIASDMEKPDGFVEVTAKGLLGFLCPLDISLLWGVGKKTVNVLHRMGIRTVGDIAKRDVRELISLLGRQGMRLYQMANGIDTRGVESCEDVKSVSNEVTFEKDTSDERIIESGLMALCEKVSRRLRKKGRKGKIITLKIRLEGFHTYTRVAVILKPTNFVDVIFNGIFGLYKKFDLKGKKVRLIGVKVSRFSPGQEQYTFFDDDKKE